MIVEQGVYLGASLLIALTVDDLGVTMAVIGATGSTTVGYILPSALYLALHRHNYEVSFWKKLLALFLLTLGLFIIPLTLTFIFLPQ
jgi:amino acid permease